MKKLAYQQPKNNFNILCFANFILGVFMLGSGVAMATEQKTYFLDESSSYYVNDDTWQTPPSGGDTIFISSERTTPLRFQLINGEQNNPIVVTNYGGQVKISGENTWGAIVFENCTHIKIAGNGHEGSSYGFELSASSCGLAFCELSSDCEACFVKIDHDGFFGIMAKKDYGGNPPSPAPVFSNLVIHDCFVQNVTEGMYLGETKSPGMEFKHVRIYNNIVRNTGRESLQIANMVEDVEIYNNTLLNAGVDGENSQNNILQIGDNSVAHVYNNIMKDAPGCGIISFGMGDIIYSNNYISSCKGIFSDNRLFSNTEEPIVISGNYFTNNIDMGWIIRNMNEKNQFEIKDNLWDTNILFYKNDSKNDSNFVLLNNQNQSIDSIIFTNPEEDDYSLAPGTTTEFLNMGAPGGPVYSIPDEPDTIVDLSEQIILNSNMIVDEVAGGSLNSASYLVDEQSCNPENDLHPISQSWKPFWNMNNGPYHVYVDLQDIYQVTEIALHDMHDIRNLDISVGEPGNWQSLLTVSCDKYKTWKELPTNVSTRYIRLSMVESVYAAVNEIVVYGYKEEGDSQEKSAMVASELTTGFNVEPEAGTDEITIFQNRTNNSLVLNIPEELRENFKIEIFNINGSPVFKENYSQQFFPRLQIEMSPLNIKNGIYIVSYSNKEGLRKTLKFYKNTLI